VCDAAFATLARLRDQPALRVVPPYYDEPVYIDALADSIDAELKRLPFTPELILASFHGIPKSYVDDGDPYPSHCEATVRLLRERMKFDETKLMLTFQSRFGRAEWLQPYTDKTVEALAKRGVRNLAVVTPGFAADCLETLEEIAVENAHIFTSNGGENFAAIPCLNDSAAGMAVISHLVERELQGWL
jgi:ferrochelatase